jgi:hypothetical protein
VGPPVPLVFLGPYCNIPVAVGIFSKYHDQIVKHILNIVSVSFVADVSFSSYWGSKVPLLLTVPHFYLSGAGTV